MLSSAELVGFTHFALYQNVLTASQEKDKDILILSVSAGRTTPYYYKADYSIPEFSVLVGMEEAMYRVDKPDYADRAVTEALVNALIHRDYIVTGSEIHIDMYDNRLEIQSPRGMFEGGTIQEYDIDSIGSVRRNPVIADLFHRMKYMERRGSGLKKILSETAKLPGYTEQLQPEFHSTPSDFRVVLKNVNYSVDVDTVHVTDQDTAHVTDHDTDHEKRIALLINYCSTARTRDEMQAYIGISSRTHFRNRILKPLLASGRLKMTLPDKSSSRNQKYIKA